MQYKPRLKIYKGYNNKCKYNPSTGEAHSYNWWCFVKVINGKVIFNDYTYSHTTTRHQWGVKHLLESLGIKVDLYVDMSSSLDKSTFKTEALEAPYRKLIINTLQLKRPNLQAKTIERCKDAIKEANTSIKAIRAMGAVFSKSQIKGLKDSIIRSETKRLTDLRAKAATKREIERNVKELINKGETFDIDGLRQAIKA